MEQWPSLSKIPHKRPVLSFSIRISKGHGVWGATRQKAATTRVQQIPRPLHTPTRTVPTCPPRPGILMVHPTLFSGGVLKPSKLQQIHLLGADVPFTFWCGFA